MTDAPKTDALHGDDHAQGQFGPATTAGAAVPSFAQQEQVPGRAEFAVGAAFVGGLIVGKLVKHRGK